ncbi:MAG: DUF924 family protein [Verrucomicrobia bacterium]|nr:DUF924 family protein [Verrucomicrobiota bacterium]
MNTLNDELQDLFLWWYGSTSETRLALAAKPDLSEPCLLSSNSFKEMNVGKLDDAWIGRWFAKGEMTQRVDDTMKNRFEATLQKASPLIDRTNIVSEKKLELMHLWQILALVVLLDQVPRNIYRGTSKAYENDAIANKLAGYIFNKPDFMKQLPIHYQATILICLCHSENAKDQKSLVDWIESDSFSQYKTGNHKDYYSALKSIIHKHAERIEIFGRFPERNKALGRKSTESETAWVQELK